MSFIIITILALEFILAVHLVGSVINIKLVSKKFEGSLKERFLIKHSTPDLICFWELNSGQDIKFKIEKANRSIFEKHIKTDGDLEYSYLPIRIEEGFSKRKYELLLEADAESKGFVSLAYSIGKHDQNKVKKYLYGMLLNIPILVFIGLAWS